MHFYIGVKSGGLNRAGDLTQQKHILLCIIKSSLLESVLKSIFPVKCWHEEKQQSEFVCKSFISLRKKKQAYVKSSISKRHRYAVSIMITSYLFSEMNSISSATYRMSSQTLKSLI